MGEPIKKKSPEYFIKAGWMAFHAVFFICLLTINILQPRIVDDYAFHNMIRAHEGLGEFLSWYYHNWTGRLQNVAGFWLFLRSDLSVLLFGVINSFVFTGFIWLCTAVILGRRPAILSGDGLIFLIVLFLMWFAIPTLSDCVIWKTGAICYLWPMLFLMLFILPYRFWLERKGEADETPAAGLNARSNPLSCSLYFLFGIWVGFSNEQVFSAAAPLALLWFVFIVMKKLARKTPLRHIAGIAGLFAGGAVQLVSPGNYRRFSGSDGRINPESFIRYAKEVYVRTGVRLSVLIVVIALCFLLAWLLQRRRAWKITGIHRACRWAIIWIFASMCSIFPFILLSDFAAVRTSFFPACFIVLAAGVLIRPLACRTGNSEPKPAFLPAVPVMMVLLLLDGMLGIQNIHAVSLEFSQRDQLIEAHKEAGGSGVLDVPPVTTNPRHTAYVYDIGNDPDNWINIAVAQYYGVSAIRLADGKKSTCSLQNPITDKAGRIDLLVRELFPFDFSASQPLKRD